MKLAAALVVAVVVAIGATAQANVWDRAIGGDYSEASNALYTEMMQRGDAAAVKANARDISLSATKADLKEAEDFYRKAAAAHPDAAEPYFRIGELLEAFYFDCTPISWLPKTCDRVAANPSAATRAIAAWDKFEALAPLDPRVTELLISRALMHTRLITDTKNATAHLEAAARDYKAFLDRTDASGLGRNTTVLGNLAETYMMLGDLDNAIDTYSEALRAGSTDATVYGLAVALDRDGRGDQARQLIRDAGVAELEQFHLAYRHHDVFYVPAGEEYYYFALTSEAFDEVEEAIADWRLYLSSGAHPEYQPRAREHLEALLKIHKKPSQRVIDPPWPTDIFP